MEVEILKDLVLNNLYVGIYTTDNQGRAIYINRTFETISGLNSKELLGRDINNLVKEKYFTASATALTLKTYKPSVVTYITKAGKKLLSRATPVFDELGQLKLIVNTVYDITEIDYKGLLDTDGAFTKTELNKQIIAYSDQMLSIIDFVMRISHVDSTVLITGESGTGKEVIARLIHSNSTRKKNLFVKVNCAAIPENLMESELFGYESGAFTGAANKGKKGFFEIAEKGTIFLDEIAELPLNMQAKLLQVLQDKQFTKIGSPRLINVDTRIIAATNRNLEEMIEKKVFREDLYYRLNVLSIHIPPLRERIDDIEPLVKYIVDRVNLKYNFQKNISSELINLFKTLPWRGNIRELENVIEKLLLIVPQNTVEMSDYFRHIQKNQLVSNPKQEIEDCEKNVLKKLLINDFNKKYIARLLGISQATLFRKIKHYNLQK